ncbi:MAG: FtsH protease activity modulator HflK, partial [Gammaproteobacteria bacterium]|nr:FtsH protease activity modulator HflK [Gammaproteobacteria bacterium]
TGIYEVEQSERAVVLRLGKYLETKGPGLNWNFPQPIEQRFVINVQKENIVEVGYRGQEGSREIRGVPREALMLTADENIIDIKFTVPYDIKNPRDRLFFVSEPTDVVVRQATESAVREVVGRSTMDFVITGGRADVTAQVHELLQNILDRYQSGINIKEVKMQDAQPPAEVKRAFDDAVKAREDEERIKNEAEAYSNDVIPRARGAAARLIQEAEAYKATVTARSTGEAARFSQILNEYRKAPEVTRARLYIETMEEVLSNSSKLMIDQSGGSNVMYLPLDQLLRERRNVSTASRAVTDFTSNAAQSGSDSDQDRGRTGGRTGRGQ